MESDHTPPAPEDWARELRARFVDVARRRVPEEDAEDLAQDAMRIVHEKGVAPGAAGPEGGPPIAWCFQVLRNVIGNYYRRRAFRGGFRQEDADPEAVGDAGPRATPVEVLESDEALRAIEAALGELRATDPKCASYLDRLVDGVAASALAAEEGVPAAALYRRVYRCREKLKGLLRGKGMMP